MRVLDPGAEDAGYFYFVMELVQGLDLHRAVIAKKLPPERVLQTWSPAGERLGSRRPRAAREPRNVLLSLDSSFVLSSVAGSQL